MINGIRVKRVETELCGQFRMYKRTNVLKGKRKQIN